MPANQGTPPSSGRPSDQIREHERSLESKHQDSAGALASPQPHIDQLDPAAEDAPLGQHGLQPPGSPLKDDTVLTKTETVASALLGQQGMHTASLANTALLRRPRVIKYWTSEILGLVLATGSIAAIFGTLAYFDGLEVPNWPLDINLTTLVSLFVTIFTTGTAASVFGVIRQAKWSWFASPRPLKDLASFDKASRGTVGSIGFLFAHRRDALSTIAAIVGLVSLVVGPFAQQAIRSVTCQYANPYTNGTVQVANFVSYDILWNAGDYLPGMNATAGMFGAMINAVSATGANESSAIVPSCPTANCTFSEYQGITHSSIALCSACFDSSAGISGPIGSFSEVYYNYTLPMGLYLEADVEQTVVLQVGSASGTDDFAWASQFLPANLSAVLPASILNVTTLTFTGSPCGDSCANGTFLLGHNDQVFQPLAVSCAIYPCLKNYRGEVVNGQFNETLVSSVPAPPSPCVVDGRAYDAGNSSLFSDSHQLKTVYYNGNNITAPYECIYMLGGTYTVIIQNLFYTSLFNGSCMINQYVTTPQCQNFWTPAFWAGGTASVESVAALMDQFTAGVTANFRRVGSDLYGRSVDVTGVALTTTVCTRVEWGWLALPTALLVLSLGLQCWVIVLSYANPKQPVWKSSLLPLLYHGFVEPVDMAPGRALDEDELKTRAEKVKVRFRSDSDAVRFEARYNPLVPSAA